MESINSYKSKRHKFKLLTPKRKKRKRKRKKRGLGLNILLKIFFCVINIPGPGDIHKDSWLISVRSIQDSGIIRALILSLCHLIHIPILVCQNQGPRLHCGKVEVPYVIITNPFLGAPFIAIGLNKSFSPNLYEMKF